MVASVLNQRAARSGALRVKQELQAKGIAPEAIAEAVAGLQGGEFVPCARGLDSAASASRRRMPPSAPAECAS